MGNPLSKLPKGSGSILAAIVLWSSLGVIVRFSGLPVQVLIFYSSLVSVAALCFVVPHRRYRQLLPRGRELWLALLLGPLLLANTSTFFYAYKYTTITNAILTHHIAPVLVALSAPLLLRERATARVMFSIVIASAGLWLLLGMDPAATLSGWAVPGSEARGIAAGLASGVANAALIIFVRYYSIKHHPMIMAFLQNLMVVLILGPFVGPLPKAAIWSVLLVGLVHSTLAPILYYRGMRHVQATHAAILGYIEPLGAIIFGMFFFAEYPAPIALLGGLLILYSGYLGLSKARAR